MATLFIAQAAHVDLSWQQQLGILGLLLLTSKGSAAVTGGGFITLAATLSSIGTLPVAGLALLLGIDRFMSEARAMTNLIGNGVAAIVVATSERSMDRERMHRLLSDFE
jgi:aerobic C4-dicarboxylate transport protein